jgi:hypothetical protein
MIQAETIANEMLLASMQEEKEKDDDFTLVSG